MCLKQFCEGMAVSVLVCAGMECAHAGEIIWDDLPAVESQWESAWYPVGNGTLGAMFTGGVKTERAQFNVDSLWTGNENASGAVDDASSDPTDRDDNRFGNYQNFGDLLVTLDNVDEKTAEYRRVLDIGRAVYSVPSLPATDITSARRSRHGRTAASASVSRLMSR